MAWVNSAEFHCISRNLGPGLFSSTTSPAQQQLGACDAVSGAPTCVPRPSDTKRCPQKTGQVPVPCDAVALVLLCVLTDTHGVSVGRIDASVNHIGSRGLEPLLQVLGGNIGLEYFNVSHNALGNNEGTDLVHVLMTESGAFPRFPNYNFLTTQTFLLQAPRFCDSLRQDHFFFFFWFFLLWCIFVSQQLSQGISWACSSRH